MMLDVEAKIKRTAKTYRLLDETVEIIRLLAIAYGTTEPKVVDALVAKYGPGDLRMKKQEKN